MDDGHIVLRRSDLIVFRRVHGAFFLIDITDNYEHDKCSLYEINEMGMFIWENINGENSLVDITNLIKAAIIDDIDYEIIYADVCVFVNELKARHFVEV